MLAANSQRNIASITQESLRSLWCFAMSDPYMGLPDYHHVVCYPWPRTGDPQPPRPQLLKFWASVSFPARPRAFGSKFGSKLAFCSRCCFGWRMRAGDPPSGPQLSEIWAPHTPPPPKILPRNNSVDGFAPPLGHSRIESNELGHGCNQCLLPRAADMRRFESGLRVLTLAV